MRRSEWWVVTVRKSRYAHVECEGFRSQKSAEKYRAEYCPEGLLLKVPIVLIQPETTESRR